jgi:hypothetical protein
VYKESLGRFVLLLAIMPAAVLLAQTTVSTGQYDNNRTGTNLHEASLNTSNVNQNSFGKLGAWNVDGRIYGQPLYIPNVTINGTTTNVVYVATQHNTVYAFDAKNLNAPPLWQVSLGPSAPSFSGTGKGCPASSAGPELGIFSTPVIDTSTGTLYAVSTSPDDSNDGGYGFYINALDIRTGIPKFGGKQEISLSVTGIGYDSVNGLVSLNNNRHAQRPALLLNKGVVYAGFASCGPDLDPWHGWIAGYSAQDVTKQMALFNATADGRAGGIWQSGSGPAGDSQGNVYFETGNGSNGVNQYGNSVVKMNATLPASNPAISAYTPPDYATLDQKDWDLSSQGPVLIPGTTYVLAGGKQGLVYLIDSNNMGTIIQTLQATSPCGYVGTGTSYCRQIHSLVYQATSAITGLLYVWGDADSLRVFSFSNGLFNTTPVTTNSSIASSTAAMALSSNGNTPGTSILWVNTRPYLRALDASTLNELWNTGQNTSRDGIATPAKWGNPTVADGRVYLPTYQKQVLIYGLLGSAPPPPSALTFSNANWTFGAHPVGQTSGTGRVNVTNSGTAAITFSSVAFTGANAADFSIVSTSCLSLTGGSTCAVVFNFTPTASGIRQANLTFTDTAAGSPQSIPVQGTATGGTPPPAGLTFSIPNWTFSSQMLGQASAPAGVTVTNGSGSAITFSSVAFSGTNPGDFQVVSNSCSSLAAAATCNVGFRFTPTVTGTRTASLTFTDTASGSPQSIPVQGTGTSTTPPASTITFSPASWGFSVHPVGEASGNGQISVKNTGGSAVTFASVAFGGANPGDFQVVSNSCSSLTVGATCAVAFNFKPTATGARTAALTFTDTAVGSPQVIPVQGTGLAGASSPSSLSFSNTSWGFGPQVVGQTSGAGNIYVTNGGTTAAIFSNVSFTGTNPGDFNIVSNSCSSLGGGATCKVSFTITPSAAGLRTASLTFTDTATGSPQSIPVQGAGY